VPPITTIFISFPFFPTQIPPAGYTPRLPQPPSDGLPRSVPPAARRSHPSKSPGPPPAAARRPQAVRYTAEPGTEDAERLALAVVLGTQALIGRA